MFLYVKACLLRPVCCVREKASIQQCHLSLIKRNLTSLWSHKNVLLALLEGVYFGNSMVRTSRVMVWCSMSRIKCPVFQVSQAPFKASGLLEKSCVVFHFKWCPWMWLVFAFCWNIYYTVSVVENLPNKGDKISSWKPAPLAFCRHEREQCLPWSDRPKIPSLEYWISDLWSFQGVAIICA